MTLQFRLTLLIFAIFWLGVASNIYRAITHARVEVAVEVNAATELTLSLLSLSNTDAPVTGLNTSAALENFLADTGNVRHIRFVSAADPGFVQQQFREELAATEVPGWFLSLLVIHNPQLIHSAVLADGSRMLIYSTPVDGIAEAWAEAVDQLFVRTLALGVFILVMLFFVGRWMQPVPVIVRVLNEMEKGDYFRKVPALPLPEFNKIGSSINHLGAVLGASSADNARLGRKAREIQEEERYYLAQELHDVQGQSMSAIKAIAVSLQQRAGEIAPADIKKNGSRIESIAQQSYDSVRDMMRSLRSFELDELGIVSALQQMADDWNDIHEETFCKLYIDGEFDDLEKTQTLCIYRIVQEALTNVSKHAKAETVRISLSGDNVVSLLIADDGVGWEGDDMEEGMGMKGLRERVSLVNGVLTLETGHNKGVSIQVEFTRHQNKGSNTSV